MIVQGRPVSPADVASRTVALPQVAKITFLNVPYDEKQAAKDLGAKWDAEKKQWYVPPLIDLAPFHRWNRGTNIELKSHYLEKDQIKYLGGKWDPCNKLWYITSNMDVELFRKWIPEPAPSSSAPSTPAGPSTPKRA